MKDYKQLIKELPSKTVVFAFGRFNPPTIGHELLVKAVKKLAQQKKADHVIYASKSQDAKKNPLSVDKKVKYLKLMFKSTNFAAASEEVRTFIEAAKQLNKKYKNIVMVAGSDRVPEFNRLLNTYNGKEFNFDTIEVISAGERDPDADDASGMSASKMRSIAVKGNYAEFKKGLPSTLRDIDGKRLMNDIREGMGLEPIKEQIVLVKDVLREQYFRGEIFNEGDIVESSGEKYTIVKRGSNHLLLKESTGKLVSKWIQDVKPTEEKEQMNEELTDKTLKPNDKIKVARVIATMLGVENAETSSNPETLINTALRKVRTKALNPEGLSILDKMLTLATSVGINYDTALKPSKLKEGVMQSNGTDTISTTTDSVVVNPKSKYNFAKDVLRFNDFKKLKKVQEQEHDYEYAAHSMADTKKDNESDHDYEQNVKVTDPSEVGHTLVHAGGQDNLRRRKVKYHLGEATTPADKASKETAKANLVAKHAAEKEALATKQAREKDSLSEAEYTGKGAGHPGWMLRADPKLALALKKSKERKKFVAGTPSKEYMDKTKTNEEVQEEREFEIGLAHNRTTKMSYKNITADNAKHAIQKANDKPKKDHSLVHLYDYEKQSFHNPKTGKKMKDQFNESHVEFRLDHRDKVTGDHKSTFADHEAKVSDTTDKATYVKVPSHKADSFKSAMKSKHGVRVELAEEVELNEGAYEKSEENKRSAEAAKKQGDMYAHHLHMADYHDNLAQWHSDKGRHSVADTHAAKSEEHHEKAMSLKEAKVPSATGDLKDACWKGYTAVGMKTKNGKKVPNCVPVNEEELDEEVCPVCGKEECECEKPEAGPVATDKPFDPFFKEDEDEIEFPEMSDDEIEKMADGLTDDDYLETYDEDELGIVDDETGEELEADEDEEEKLKESKLMEVLSRVERMKAKARIRRTKAKRERATKIALKRYSNTATINKRARRLAVKLMKQRLLRGRDPSKISVGEKERIERTLERRKAIIGRVAMRLAPRVRKVEKARLSHSKYTQGSPNVAF